MNGQQLLKATCDVCGQHIAFPRDCLGTRVQCPGCACETLLTLSSSGLAPIDSAISGEELANGFGGKMRNPEVPLAYGVALLVNAIFVLLLPLGYIALVLAALLGVGYYATSAGQVLFARNGPGIIVGSILYVGPIVGGLIAVFFLFKPLLARRRVPSGVQLKEEENPGLFQLVQTICQILDARRPSAVYLTPHVEAGASVQTLGRKRELFLGLSLVGGCTVEQLGAVIAHEVAHGRQSTTFRLYNLVERISRWFERVVFERDPWDQAFDEWSESLRGSLLGVVGTCCRLGVFLSRRVLTCFLVMGRAGTCYMLRQMEHHADACAVALVGSSAAEATLLRVRELGILERFGHQSLAEIWNRHKQVPESLPDFLELLDGRILLEEREQIAHTVVNQRATLFDSHPTDAQRIQKMRIRSEPGVFHLNKPARSLFGSFSPLCAETTLRYYNDILGLRVGRMMLKPAGYFFGDPDCVKRFVVPTHSGSPD